MIENTLLQAGPGALTDGISYVWVLLVTFLIFFMHAGFAMLEAGQVRAKNVANQLTKNLLTWSVGVTVFFFVGIGVGNLAAGNGFETATFLSGVDWIEWLYGAVFAMTAATIVSGAVAGRAKLRAYVLYTILLSAVIYPVVIGFTWLPGTGIVAHITGALLGTQVAFHDFAGGMIVHGMGGIAGLTAAWILGPRMGRFNDDGSVNVIPGHSITFAVLGTLLLAFGWYGFNVGTAAVFTTSGGTTTFNAAILGRVAITTTLAMAAGAMGAGLVSWYKTGKVDTLYVANGLLAGLVGITAIADTTTQFGAFAVGLLAGAQLPIVFGFVEKRLHVDDVCAVFPVHGSTGILGALLFPLVAVDSWNGFSPNLTFIAQHALAQVIGVLVIAVWTLAATILIWGGLRAIDQSRVTPDHEREGLDLSEHGVETYPEFGREEGVVADGGFVSQASRGTPKPRPDGGDSDE